MNKGFKIAVWIIGVLIVLGIILFIWVRNIIKGIKFYPPKLQGLDLQGITLQDLYNSLFEGQSKTVTVKIGMDINNNNNFSIRFNNMSVKLLYNNTVIGATSDALRGSKQLPAKGALSISDVISIELNNTGRQLLISKLNGSRPNLEYAVNVSIYGIPIPTIKNNFLW